MMSTLFRLIVVGCSLLITVSTTLAQPAFKFSKQPLTLGETYTFHSEVLSEDRVLNIYLPSGYDPNDTVLYPVVYLLDGGIDEDFIHVAGILQFNVFAWVAAMPPSVLIGIANVDRKRDFTWPSSVESDKKELSTSGGARKFILFIETELIPFMHTHFKTNAQRTLLGESLGGLLAADILLTKPDMFDKYAIVSPSVWWDGASILEKKMATVRHTIDVYVAVGKEGLTPGPNPRAMETDARLFVDRLKSANSKLLNVHFDYLPEENHATIGHQAYFNGLKWLNRKK